MAATHYVEATRGRNRLTRALKTHLTLRGIMDKLLRKTVQRNTWIYHSSFLSGGIVTSAGLISVKKGTLYTISPLSGHYRTTISHFRKFVEIMKERGVDMHKAKVSKAEAALWGIEHIGKAQKAKSSAIKSTKEGVKDAVHKVTDVSWKRDVLEGRRKKDEKAAQDEGKDVSGEPSDDKRPQPNGTHDAGEKPAADVTGSDKEGHPDGGASDAVASE
ncbi:hypothetical protein PLICRDRAFT_407640 [Plicaturopsis crispa FD-325 SS-3]|nr:hypothetical protein PLICRDRAFT_407640 [Plicaturopsis crispa FD-325 SS-3]